MLPGVFADYSVSIARVANYGVRELVMPRWGCARRNSAGETALDVR